ncbi:DUF1501 domain-containing protein [Planctomicrobium piriforme]|uniref:Uncharacterized conserved protein, DUF1501 family n=1 Tax=Planctomicrobium piriforme TaxID=1576369 RepID=A0A1I3PT52_9PLAN|nr:DUF1501 domain-containing protein [Planctomicrobium piriforme]SFJ24562.1 Uncharacterized conserved protein, DUF1501 family [Planctomicrobium piriforme]
MRTFSLDTLSRRDMMCRTAQQAFGLTVLPGLASLAAAAEAKPSKKPAPAKNLIYIRLSGAMSHIDTFDPKPGKDVMGETKAISTSLPGVQFGEFLPKLAAMANQLAIIRSMNTSTADHDQASYLLQTSYRKIASIAHPGLGSWAQKIYGDSHKSLPSTVQIGGGVGPGYLGSRFAPVPIGNPDDGLQNTKSPAYLTNENFDKRMELSKSFDAAFRELASHNSQVKGYDDLYNNAITLLRSEDLKVFDLKLESDKAKQAYGTSRVGRGALLARRLVQNGVRCVEVNFGGFDHHTELWDRLPPMAAQLDQALSALLADLKETGLLSHTVVAVSAEFGRGPHINQRSGRDHHPAAFSSLLAGAGIKTGQVYGKSDEEAFHIDADGVEPNDLNATIARCLGIDTQMEIFSPSGRPFRIGNGSKGIEKLLS